MARKILMVLGVTQVLLGCVLGLIPPSAVQHFRSLITAHIEFCMNGMLLALIGFLYDHMTLGPFLAVLLDTTAIVGTFTNGGAFVLAAFTGASTILSPLINSSHPPPLGTDGYWSHVITNSLVVCAIATILSLIISIIGLLRHDKEKEKKH